jgi:hypothetical protein
MRVRDPDKLHADGARFAAWYNDSIVDSSRSKQGPATMSESLIVDLPDDIAQQARALACATNRRLEDVVLDWIRQAIAEPEVESLSDEDVLRLCDLTLDDARQEELSDLLAMVRQDGLATTDRERLDHLMAAYRRGLVLKARALKEAVARGLKLPLADDAA